LLAGAATPGERESERDARAAAGGEDRIGRRRDPPAPVRRRAGGPFGALPRRCGPRGGRRAARPAPRVEGSGCVSEAPPLLG
jgi:hypothetical protein